MSKQLIIGISGKMGSGKSTVGNIFNEYFSSIGLKSICISFADSLKRDVENFLKVPIDKNIPGIRQILQGYGQACKHVYGEDYWIKRLDEKRTKELFDYKVIIISDLRFKNEEQYIKNNNGLIHTIFIESEIREQRLRERGDKDLQAQNDISERYIPQGDFILYNNVSHSELVKHCQKHAKYLNDFFF